MQILNNELLGTVSTIYLLHYCVDTCDEWVSAAWHVGLLGVGAVGSPAQTWAAFSQHHPLNQYFQTFGALYQ